VPPVLAIGFALDSVHSLAKADGALSIHRYDNAASGQASPNARRKPEESWPVAKMISKVNSTPDSNGDEAGCDIDTGL